jgi:hypothetical protein
MNEQQLGMLISLYSNYKWTENQLLSLEYKFKSLASKELLKEWEEEKLRIDNSEWRLIQ